MCLINAIWLFVQHVGYIWGWTINSKILQQGNKRESQIQVGIKERESILFTHRSIINVLTTVTDTSQ